MFIVSLEYIKPLSVIESLIDEHYLFVNEQIDSKKLIIAGRKVPRTGGMMFFDVRSIDELNEIIRKDVFYKNQVAVYHIQELTPTKFSTPNVMSYFESLKN